MKYTYDYPCAMPTADVVLFGHDSKEDYKNALKILLVRRADKKEAEFHKFSLPGGFMNCLTEYDLESCAKRELMEETGVTFTFLEQLYTFSKLGRDPREPMGTFKRIITTAYIGITNNMSLGQKEDGVETDAVQWHSVNNLPPTAFDHSEIIAKGVERLQSKLWWELVSFKFLPKTFTVGELKKVFEMIDGKKLDLGNFRKYALSSKDKRKFKLIETEKIRKLPLGKPAMIYKMEVK